jgi:hypothetical protein
MLDGLHRTTPVRVALLAMGALALLAGLWSGLLRLGWAGPSVHADFPAAHGPLMVCGFLGTMISLERAVALRRTWAFTAPLLCGTGGLLVLAGVGGAAGPMLLTAGSAGLVAIFGAVLAVRVVPFVIVMAGGAAAWAVGNGLWIGGWPVHRLVPWWIGFLVLTIAGERLELSRVLGHRRWTKRAFLAIVGLLAAALVATLQAPDDGFRVLGGALAALALWLLAFDVARQTVRGEGLPRFTAVCLLGGYAWLAVGGMLMVAHGNPGAGFRYDAALHAVFVGFVFSMIFGHAPVIVPSVLGVSIPFWRVFYVHVGLLHAGLLVRLVGDLRYAEGLRGLGGWANAGAILLFIAVTAASALQGGSEASSKPSPGLSYGAAAAPEAGAAEGASSEPEGASDLTDDVPDLDLEAG